MSKLPAMSAELSRCEDVIERHLESFLEVGIALLEIKENRLYKDGFDTFQEYCEQRWGMSRSYAYRLINASEVVSEMSPIGDKLPTSESQTRELAKIKDPEERTEVWNELASEMSPQGDKMPTAQDVREAVESKLDPPEPEVEHEDVPDEPETDARHDQFVASWIGLENRLTALRMIFDRLEPHELVVVGDWIEG